MTATYSVHYGGNFVTIDVDGDILADNLEVIKKCWRSHYTSLPSKHNISKFLVRHKDNLTCQHLLSEKFGKRKSLESELSITLNENSWQLRSDSTKFVYRICDKDRLAEWIKTGDDIHFPHGRVKSLMMEIPAVRGLLEKFREEELTRREPRVQRLDLFDTPKMLLPKIVEEFTEIPASVQTQQQEKTIEPTVNHLLLEKQRIQKNFKTALYQTGANQAGELAKEILVELFGGSDISEEEKSFLRKILDKERSTKFVKLLVGTSAPHLPFIGDMIQENHHLMIIMDQMQISGFRNVFDDFLDDQRNNLISKFSGITKTIDRIESLESSKAPMACVQEKENEHHDELVETQVIHENRL